MAHGPWCPVLNPASAVNAIKTSEFIFQAVDIGRVIYFKTDVILVSVHVGLFDYFNVVLAKGCAFIKKNCVRMMNISSTASF